MRQLQMDSLSVICINIFRFRGASLWGSGVMPNDDVQRISSRVTCAERYRHWKHRFGADVPDDAEETITYSLATTRYGRRTNP